MYTLKYFQILSELSRVTFFVCLQYYIWKTFLCLFSYVVSDMWLKLTSTATEPKIVRSSDHAKVIPLPIFSFSTIMTMRWRRKSTQEQQEFVWIAPSPFFPQYKADTARNCGNGLLPSAKKREPKQHTALQLWGAYSIRGRESVELAGMPTLPDLCSEKRPASRAISISTQL